jgi:uncharacterized lipoprotein YddW (UPF0748 family)
MPNTGYNMTMRLTCIPWILSVGLLTIPLSKADAPLRPQPPSRGQINIRAGEINRTSAPIMEARALWVTRASITSPAAIAKMVSDAKRAGFNMLFVQVRGRGDAFYRSTLEPRSEELAGQPLSFDPLAETVKQAHAARLQVHAWLNTDFVWSGSKRPKSPEHIINAHPDWMARTSAGIFTTKATDQCEGAFVSPAIPAARKHIHDVFLEIAKNYQVDGVHFDYIRYPNLNYDYGPETLSLFCADMSNLGMNAPKPNAKEHEKMMFVRSHFDKWQTWRRQQVTDMVEEIARDIHALGRPIMVSAAVFANWKEANIQKGQDWKRWLKDGALDAVVPMAYGSSTQSVAKQIEDASNAARQSGKICIAGIGSWHISASSSLAKIYAARYYGAQGFSVFSYGGVTKDGKTMDYLYKIDAADFNRPAYPPTLAQTALAPAPEPKLETVGAESDK